MTYLRIAGSGTVPLVYSSSLTVPQTDTPFPDCTIASAASGPVSAVSGAQITIGATGYYEINWTFTLGGGQVASEQYGTLRMLIDGGPVATYWHGTKYTGGNNSDVALHFAGLLGAGTTVTLQGQRGVDNPMNDFGHTIHVRFVPTPTYKK